MHKSERVGREAGSRGKGRGSGRGSGRSSGRGSAHFDTPPKKNRELAIHSNCNAFGHCLHSQVQANASSDDRNVSVVYPVKGSGEWGVLKVSAAL